MTESPDRARWLRDRRAAVEAQYDLEAAGYDDEPYTRTSHASFVDRLLATCPPDGRVLDAPCGTGTFFGQVQRSGHRVVGIDQSAGMLGQARAKGIADELLQVGLQEMAFEAEFDGSMTIDAMENVPPEDWPTVLANLRRAVTPGGHLYITVEEIEDTEIDEAFRSGTAQGLPLVRGEVIEGDTAGYHYYPGRVRVRDWLAVEDLSVVAEAEDWEEDGWGYWHLLLHSSRPPSD
jgi:ubiquinone/menaquinone biosynthesis C-methylase UbiE